MVIASDVSELKETVTRMRRVLDEREVLIREIHHRVKNNLQIVSSLLVMERNRTETEPQERRGMDRALSRIRTIARIHQQLYDGRDFAHVDLSHYLRELSEDIAIAHDPGRELRLDVSDDGVGYDDRSKRIGGLGLSLVEALVSQMDGTITFANREGTHVTVSAPGESAHHAEQQDSLRG